MSAVGGPIESVSINGRNFAVAEDADASVVYGGDQNELGMNGNDTARLIKSKMGWKVSGLALQIDPDNNDHEFIQDIIDGNEFVDYEHTEVDGNVYYGSGQIIEEVGKSTKNATAELTFSGPGRLTKQ